MQMHIAQIINADVVVLIAVRQFQYPPVETGLNYKVSFVLNAVNVQRLHALLLDNHPQSGGQPSTQSIVRWVIAAMYQNLLLMTLIVADLLPPILLLVNDTPFCQKV